MNQHTVPPLAPAPIDVEPMQRLADRLTGLVPPPAATPLMATPVELPPPSAAVTAALEKSAARAAEAKRRASLRSRPLSVRIVDSFVAACAFIPYALVAFALRLAIARVFFLDGQSKVEGTKLTATVYDFDVSVVLPLHVKGQALGPFLARASDLPVSPSIAAYAVCYAEFLLPILLVIGLGTRFASLALIGLTALMGFYLMPQALWTAHIYWASILLVLLSLGPGAISVDHILRSVSRR